MFGYIYVNEQELKLKEYTIYRSFYCGLCHNLKQRYGRTAQMMLNYDLTFLALLLSGLYEPDTESFEKRCIPHPVKKHKMVENEAVDYAADMCVLVSYQKLKDDWEDEKKQTRRAAAAMLRPAYEKVAEKYPRQVKAIEENIRLLHEAEHQNCKDIDYVAGLTGKFLAELFVWKDDIWQDELRTMGFFMGKYIYLMDALEDVEQDKKNKNYNLFSEYGPVWGTEKEKEIHEILVAMMTEVSRSFERLPILQNAEIIRNILYSGVWCKYVMIKERNSKQEKDKK
ncbi:MAG: DUF5685 family protein [Lachnospiraceae bacterium]|nr:DUF5685 family protein [Lachnospiraceae bacterium]MDD7077086.1 DUF5685 family protein [Lachnospiraceae bacterium]MDY3729966.1 DUF5685 family protein [Candidatus Choladocola sp.]